MFYQIALKIDSAKRFINKERIGKHVLDHTVYECGGSVRTATVSDRTDCPDDTLPLHCVANAIAVLSGDRPVPSKRAHSPMADYAEFQHYMDMARRARIHIVSDSNNQSMMQTAKASMYNLATDGAVSCKQKKTSAKLNIDGVDYDLTRGCPTHHAIGIAWPREIYLAFDKLCKTVLGDNYKEKLNVLQTLTELRKKYVKNDTRLMKFFETLSEQKPVTVIERDLVDPVARGIVGGSIFRGETWARSSELKSWGAPIAVHGDPQLTWVINGMIYLKVTEDELEAILKGPEAATILDGGTLYPVDSNGSVSFGSLREIVTRWDDSNDAYPTPFEA